MSVIIVKSGFPIDPSKVSKRLFFAKRSNSDTVWHIVDAALGRADRNDVLEFIALHGKYIYTGVKADTVFQADILRGNGDTLCARCLDEFNLALADIEEKESLEFQYETIYSS